MSVTSINIQTDSEIKAKAQEIFAMLGLDMTTAVNLCFCVKRFARTTFRLFCLHKISRRKRLSSYLLVVDA